MSVLAVALTYIEAVATSASERQAMLQIVGVALFVSSFLSLLCFIAAASTLYAKVFTQLDEDHRVFARLRRIGLSPRGVGRLLLGELTVLFFAPVAVTSSSFFAHFCPLYT
jgi:putative ABC transport system permease protein